MVKYFILTLTLILSSSFAHAALGGAVAEPDRQDLVLNSVGDVEKARVTFYNPNNSSRLEGGPKNQFSEPINSIEDAIRNGRPVTLAADTWGKFGADCNRREKRCLILIKTEGFDRLFPAYRGRFPNLPRNSFLGIVEDTGGAFYGTKGKRFDLAARNQSLANTVPGFFAEYASSLRLANPCGQGKDSRHCVLVAAKLAEAIVQKL